MKVPLHLLSDNFIKTKHITEETPYTIKEIDARLLLCANRLDIAAKIAYIEARENNADMGFVRELYKKHIEAFSEGYFIEPGDENKTSIEQFFVTFDQLIDDYKMNGFDAQKSLIPIGKNNVILDGAHRTACAIYFGGNVSVIEFPQFEVSFNYSYFRTRRLSEEMLEYMALVYSRYAVTPLYMACLWPVAQQSKRSAALKRITTEHNIVLDTSVVLNNRGLRNFMIQVYQNQDWIGTVENHFSGVLGKVDECFTPGCTTEVILFENGILEDVLSMKEDIRKIFQLGKHAIHISDSNEETKFMASLLYNENSRHALNYGKPDMYPERFYEMEFYKGTNTNWDMNATLAYYGIIDVGKVEVNDSMVDAFNPRSYFTYDGMRFPAFSYVKRIKKSLDGEAGKNFDKLMKAVNRNERKRKIEDLKTSEIWRIRKMKLYCKQIAMHITKKIGVYDMIYKLRHR